MLKKVTVYDYISEEIEARIEKINKEYKRSIYPLVVGEFKN